MYTEELWLAEGAKEGQKGREGDPEVSSHSHRSELVLSCLFRKEMEDLGRLGQLGTLLHFPFRDLTAPESSRELNEKRSSTFA